MKKRPGIDVVMLPEESPREGGRGLEIRRLGSAHADFRFEGL